MNCSKLKIKIFLLKKFFCYLLLSIATLLLARHFLPNFILVFSKHLILSLYSIFSTFLIATCCYIVATYLLYSLFLFIAIAFLDFFIANVCVQLGRFLSHIMLACIIEGEEAIFDDHCYQY